MVWYGQPLMALILLAALQTIPQALYDAANVDGASAWQRFRYITLPHLMPSILFLVLLRLIWMSNHIDMIFVLTQGGPGFSNYTAAIYSFKLTNQFEIGYASAVAVVLTILLVAASALYVRHLARKVLVIGMTHRPASASTTRRFWMYGGRRRGPPLFAGARSLWIVIASITPEVKDYGTLSNRQVTYFPAHPTFDNYVDLFVNNPFALYFRNSTIIATGNMLLTLVVASLGAYAFVRFRFAGAARCWSRCWSPTRSRASCCWCRCW